MNHFAVTSKNISLGGLLGDLSEKNRRRAALMALNKTARDYRVVAAEQIRKEVAFPAGYLAPAQKRFYVKKQATEQSLEAIIEAKARATSLARFVQGDKSPWARSPTVQVDPGRSVTLKRAFLMPLNVGASGATDTVYNLGLAIRLRRGETLNKSMQARRIGENLYLLYGPSVYQAFINNQGEGVAKDLTPNIEEAAVTEFLRLLDRKR